MYRHDQIPTGKQNPVDSINKGAELLLRRKRTQNLIKFGRFPFFRKELTFYLEIKDR